MMCSTCEFKKYEPSLWFLHIWNLYRLQRGGYPFEKNDLSLVEWVDLGLLRDALESKKG